MALKEQNLNLDRKLQDFPYIVFLFTGTSKHTSILYYISFNTSVFMNEIEQIIVFQWLFISNWSLYTYQVSLLMMN